MNQESFMFYRVDNQAMIKRHNEDIGNKLEMHVHHTELLFKVKTEERGKKFLLYSFWEVGELDFFF